MIIESLAIWLGFCCLFIVYMVARAYFKTKSIQGVKDHFNATEGKGAVYGIVAALVIPILIILSISAVKAETRWLGDTVVFIGMENTKKVSPMCYEGGIDDRLTSNLGASQHLLGYGNVDLIAQYTHHSCAINRDTKSYDAIGLRLEYRIR